MLKEGVTEHIIDQDLAYSLKYAPDRRGGGGRKKDASSWMWTGGGGEPKISILGPLSFVVSCYIAIFSISTIQSTHSATLCAITNQVHNIQYFWLINQHLIAIDTHHTEQCTTIHFIMLSVPQWWYKLVTLHEYNLPQASKYFWAYELYGLVYTSRCHWLTAKPIIIWFMYLL